MPWPLLKQKNAAKPRNSRPRKGGRDSHSLRVVNLLLLSVVNSLRVIYLVWDPMQGLQ